METFEGIKKEHYTIVNRCDNVRQLEEMVRKYNIYNMND